MVEDMPQDQPMSDDDILTFTQLKRKALIDDITKEGLPKDNKDRRLLLVALSDMDQTALNNKRIGAQQKMADADRLAALAIARLNKTLGGRNPFEVKDVDGNQAPRKVEVDDKFLPEANPVEGETDIGISTMNYEEFMGKFNK